MMDDILSYVLKYGRCGMGAMSLRLPDDLDEWLDREAKLEQIPRSEVARLAIAEYLAKKEKERFMEELVAAAKALAADPEARAEALALAEEGLEGWLDNLEAEERAAGIDPDEKWWR